MGAARGRRSAGSCAASAAEYSSSPQGPAGRRKKKRVSGSADTGTPPRTGPPGPRGRGTRRVFPNAGGEGPGRDRESMGLRASDPDGPHLVGEGTIGSRSMMAHGGALVVAAREVVRKGTELAAKDLEVAPNDLEFSKGRYRVKGTDVSIGMEDLAKKYGSAPDSGGEIPLPRSFPSGAHGAEVEIDPEPGVVELPRYTAVDDCGRIINHVLLDGQLHGGIAQGIGQAMGEHAVYDQASGQLLTGTLMDYEIPRAAGMPDIRLYDRSIPSPGNPLGANAAREAVTTRPVPARADARIVPPRPLGIHSLDFPYPPDRIWHAIREAKGR